MITDEIDISPISFSLLGLSPELIVELMESVKHASCGREDTKGLDWFFAACLDEIECRQSPELERGFIRPPCEDWTAGELSDFYRTVHVLSYGPIPSGLEKVVDDMVLLSLAHVLCRIQNLERKLACFTR